MAIPEAEPEGGIMDREAFERRMRGAKIFERVGREGAEYWQAYQRGLRRRYYGKRFGTDEMHHVWMVMAESGDPVRAKRGKGYRDGYIPEFCPNGGDCQTCPLVSQGRDCQNNPL